MNIKKYHADSNIFDFPNLYNCIFLNSGGLLSNPLRIYVSLEGKRNCSANQRRPQSLHEPPKSITLRNWHHKLRTCAVRAIMRSSRWVSSFSRHAWRQTKSVLELGYRSYEWHKLAWTKTDFSSFRLGLIHHFDVDIIGMAHILLCSKVQIHSRQRPAWTKTLQSS